MLKKQCGMLLINMIWIAFQYGEGILLDTNKIMMKEIKPVCNKFQTRTHHRLCVDKRIWKNLDRYITLRTNGSIGRSI
ncbi:MAG: hypothetical protein ACFFA3_16780 [Promethearchaeota archaeon]